MRAASEPWSVRAPGRGAGPDSVAGTRAPYQPPPGLAKGPDRASRPCWTKWAAPSVPRSWARAKVAVMRALIHNEAGRPTSTLPSARKKP